MISSRVRLGDTRAWIEIQIECDPVTLSDDDWDFVKLLVDTLRNYEREKDMGKDVEQP